MAKCINCGSSQWNLAERNGALETWRCEACNKQETVHVFDPSSEPTLPSDLPPVFVIAARLTAKLSEQQIIEIKEIFPNLKAISASALSHKALSHSSFDVGRFTDEEIQRFEPALRRLGVLIERIPVEITSSS